MRYRVGNKVRVRKDLKVNQKYGDCYFVEEMRKYRGRTVEIVEAFKASDNYQIKEDEEIHYWSEEMFEPVITNFDKVKEEMEIEYDGWTYAVCRAIHKVKKEDDCYDRNCAMCKKWLKQPYEEPKKEILDKQEKEYLSAVIKPFRNKNLVISKRRHEWGKEEYIVIGFDAEALVFPNFEEDTMYKGMELGREYTLEELGL